MVFHFPGATFRASDKFGHITCVIADIHVKNQYFFVFSLGVALVCLFKNFYHYLTRVLTRANIIL